ncbi:transmembrane protein 154 [Bufo gargarizans]|uniref:transmembrane protein 154 n=1 Tax=Bufo gargarizans TaxID=30331 RepID=UPI001CF4F0E9|nr:transmembrane protein 154 [Bufo gargarizans]
MMDETTTEKELISTGEPFLVYTTEEYQTLSPATLDTATETGNEVTESSDVFGSDVITILIYAAPAIILVLLIPIIILIVQRKRRKKQQEAILDVPADKKDLKSPIFEEDTPSVMEIEMDDLDKWMSNMKNSCRLSALEEENKFHTRNSALFSVEPSDARLSGFSFQDTHGET